MINNRKRQLRYLRRYNPEEFQKTYTALNLTDIHLLKSGKGDKHGPKYFKSN